LRAYSESDEEARRAHDLLKDWAGEGYITAAQHRQMQPETLCKLRRTNIVLRLVSFLFTLLVVAAAVGLVVFLQHTTNPVISVYLLLSALVCYGAVELAISQASLYRFGIEEALAVSSVGLLCAGLMVALQASPSSPARSDLEFLGPLTGTIFSLWIWYRFGLPYVFFAAMLFAVWLTTYLTSSRTEQHIAVAAFFAVAQFVVVATAPRYRHTYLQQRISIAEALLWLGIYLAFNVELSGPKSFWMDWGGIRTTAELPRPFYWSTWALIWCLPPVVLARGLRQRDKVVFASGILVTLLTLLTNKSYLGGERHTWDPMILGALLIGIAVAVRHWLATGPGGVRHGFTAQRLSGRDKSLLDAGVAAAGLVSPHVSPPASPAPTPEVRFQGGDSGGAGASSDF